MSPDQENSGAVLLILAEPAGALARESAQRLGRLGLAVEPHELSAAARASDRRALEELGRALEELARRPAVDAERIAALGFGRGGTLAFLLGCARRLAAVVDVEGPLLHPELSAERPIQPLELALNLEGSFLGLFAGRSGRVSAEETGLLRDRLSSAARPFDIVVFPGAEDAFFDPRAAGFGPAPAEELWRHITAFLEDALEIETGRNRTEETR